MLQMKIRAWDAHNKKMRYPKIIGIGSDRFSWDFSRNEIHNSLEWNGEDGYVHMPIITQFIGVIDKNNIDIYQGDIVRKQTLVRAAS